MSSESNRTHLLIIEDTKGRREIKLNSPVYSLGRDPKCDLRLFSQYVSRRHATLVQLTDEHGVYYRIVDGNLKGKPSANGIRVNSRRVQAHDLQDGDKVVFGPEVFATYYSLDAKEASAIFQSYDTTLINMDMIGDDDTM